MPAAPRQTRARIVEIRRETPDATVFWLAYARPYRFRPGQWIDLYVTIDGRRQVGGYSITSTARTPGRIRIAVRHSDTHPVTRWLGRSARVGDAVWVSEGQGDFFYERARGDRLVLLAGGIGITPLAGILSEVYEAHPEVAATLVYGAGKPSEFLFRTEFDAMAAERDNIRCLYTVTRPGGHGWRGFVGRVDHVLTEELGVDPQASYYLCGPRGFVEGLVRELGSRAIPAARLFYERWW